LLKKLAAAPSAAQARSPLDNFKHAFKLAAMYDVVGRMERNKIIAAKFMSSAEFRPIVMEAMMREFWQKARSAAD
jgi:membrane carboxypeptidase/penicillin-binding protein